jgi:exopolyphosphatase/pppGpp-phosphohydrolase
VDLGSGTIKWSVFAGGPGAWEPLVLEEVNTELRQGMGDEATLKPKPVSDTLSACADFLARARTLELRRLPAYGTSALRKAKNPELLFHALEQMGMEPIILGPEEEGRLNLLGLLAGQAGLTRAGDATKPLVIDPGGDSTELCADLDRQGWERATVASLPLGSVSLQERFGSGRDNQALAWEPLERVVVHARETLERFPAARPFAGASPLPSIRMNLPVQRALDRVNGLAEAAHGRGGPYTRAELLVLVRELAARDRAGRAALLDGEPLGKMDRTAYGMASWLGILEGLQSEHFLVEPWGIKLGAALFLNQSPWMASRG